MPEFEELERQMIQCIRGALAHKYTVDEMTDAMWRIVNAGADEAEKDRVMAVLLTNYGFGFMSESDCLEFPPRRGMGERKFINLVEQVRERAVDFAKSLLRENRHPIVAARKLRRFLNSFKDEEERMAVLYVVLQSSFTPYVRIPRDFESKLNLPDSETFTDPRVRESIALVHMAYAASDEINDEDIFVFMLRILERHNDLTEKLLVLGHVMKRYGEFVIDNAEEEPEHGSSDEDVCEEYAVVLEKRLDRKPPN